MELTVFYSSLTQILSMIEEAAGTRLYESKRENAEKIIEKKEGKLREIDVVSVKLFHFFPQY